MSQRRAAADGDDGHDDHGDRDANDDQNDGVFCVPAPPTIPLNTPDIRYILISLFFITHFLT